MSFILSKFNGNGLQAIALVIGMTLFVLSGLSSNMVYIFILLPSVLVWARFKTGFSVDGYLWLFYLLYVFASSLWSGGDFYNFFESARYLLYTVLFLHGLYLYRKSNVSINCVLWGMLFAVIFIEAFSIFMYVYEHGFTTWVERFPRLYGKFGVESPIDISCILVLCVLALMANNNIRPLHCILVFLAVAVLISPFQTRISLLGLGAGVLVILFQKKYYKMMAVSFGVAVLVILFYYFGLDRFSSNRYPRLDIWTFAFNKVVENCHVLYGCGFGYDFDIKVSGRHYAQLHSLIWSQFFYGGLLGFIAFSGIVIRTLWVLLKDKSPWLGVFVYSLVVLMTNRHEIISNPSFVWLMLWVPIGLSGVLFKNEGVRSSREGFENPSLDSKKSESCSYSGG